MDATDTQNMSSRPQERGSDPELPPRRVEGLIISRVAGPLRGNLDHAKLRRAISKVSDLAPISPDELDAQVRVSVERWIKKMADTEPEWAGQTLDTLKLYTVESLPALQEGCSLRTVRPEDNGSGQSGGTRGLRDPIDDALAEELDSSECDRLERRIRKRINQRRASLFRSWGNRSGDPMRNIAGYFSQAGDYMRLGILSQKRSR